MRLVQFSKMNGQKLNPESEQMAEPVQWRWKTPKSKANPTFALRLQIQQNCGYFLVQVLTRQRNGFSKPV